MIKCVILAGGLGTRLRSVVSDVPKPMADIRGKPFLCYLMKHYINRLREVEFILSVGYKSATIKKYFGNQFENCSISYVEEECPLGTGGALKNVLNAIDFEDKTFLLTNGDTFVDFDLEEFQRMHLQSSADVTVCAIKANERDRFGKLTIQGTTNKVNEFQSAKGDVDDYCNGGVYLINPNRRFRDYLKSDKNKFSFEADILNRLVKEGNVYAFPTNGYFIDIGVPNDYLLAQHHLRNDRSAN